MTSLIANLVHLLLEKRLKFSISLFDVDFII